MVPKKFWVNHWAFHPFSFTSPAPPKFTFFQPSTGPWPAQGAQASRVCRDRAGGAGAHGGAGSRAGSHGRGERGAQGRRCGFRFFGEDHSMDLGKTGGLLVFFLGESWVKVVDTEIFCLTG